MGEQDSLLPVGKTFNRFKVVARLGRGGMGEVYHALDTRLGGRDVALKIMLPRYARLDPTAGLRFLREAEIASRIQHPNIACVYDLGLENDTPFIVMEYLKGCDLAQVLTTQGPLSTADAANYLLPVCSALAAAHDGGVVHRDVKPSNIFLATGPDGERRPKVLDFGVAHPMRLDIRSDPVAGLAGTADYFAPELLIGEGFIGPAADVYALGVTFYELLVGVTPYAYVQEENEVFTKIQWDGFPPLSAVWPEAPPAVDRVIQKATRPIPASRYSSTRSLGRALLPFASDAVRLRYEGEFTSGSRRDSLTMGRLRSKSEVT